MNAQTFELARAAFKSEWSEIAKWHRDGDPACKAWRESKMDRIIDAWQVVQINYRLSYLGGVRNGNSQSS